MKLGIAIEETWAFFDHIYEFLDQEHDVTLFQRRAVKLPRLNGRINDLLFRRDLEDLLKNNDVCFFEWASELLAAATKLPKHCCVVTRLHRYELYRWAEKVNWDAVDKIIVVSNAKKKEFSRRFPAQASKLVVIPEAISLEKFHYNAKEYNGDIGILCHLRPRKRVYELILAFHQLVNTGDNFHLHVGGGMVQDFQEYHAAIHTLVEELDLEDRVTFYGNVIDSASWYKNVDIFVSNSYSEGLQVSPMEAVASGRYCISHRWPGAEELLPQEDLYTTDSELISLIQNYNHLSQEGRGSRRAEQYQQVVDEFQVSKVAAQINSVLEDVAKERTG